jgi:serine/threonine-protein kinase
MAEVHRGRDVRLGRDVAIKLLRADLARDPSFQSRFRREAQAAASLNHPSIVAVYDSGEDRETGVVVPYIVMEYVEGRTLREVLQTEGRLLPRRALEITAQICAALDQAHRAGIVHRDMKPGNVMLTALGEVKVMDFGIARAMTSAAATMTQTAAVIGTAHYLSPEQARGEHVDARSDIYSTGCLLYELLTGAPPFTGDTPVAIAYQHVREEPMAPSQVEPDVPAAADAVVFKAMAKNPANRYQSAAAMRADLERALAGRPVEASPAPSEDTLTIPPPPPTTVLLRQPPARRGRGVAYALLALATLLVFVIALLVARGLLTGNSGQIGTPNVVGATYSDARSVIFGKGLKVGTVKQDYNNQYAKGVVYQQNPIADILLSKGDPVDLWVSLGARTAVVPTNLIGLTSAEAKSALAAAGLQVGQIVPQNSNQSPDQVLNVSPAPGTQVAYGSKVTLYVSNGRVKVPNVTGMTLFAATQQLEQAGFAVSADPPDSPTGSHVLSENPAAGSYVAYGSTIVVHTDAPSPTPSPTQSPTPTPPPSTPAPTPSGSTPPVTPFR